MATDYDAQIAELQAQIDNLPLSDDSGTERQIRALKQKQQQLRQEQADLSLTSNESGSWADQLANYQSAQSEIDTLQSTDTRTGQNERNARANRLRGAFDSQNARQNAEANTPEWQAVVTAYNKGESVPNEYVGVLDQLNGYYRQGQAAPGNLTPETASQAFTQWKVDARPGGFDKFVDLGMAAGMAYLGGGMLNSMGSTGSTMLNKAISQGATSAGTTLARGGSFEDALTAGVTGGVTGGLTAGFSSFVPNNLGQIVMGGDGVASDAINAFTQGSIGGGAGAAVSGRDIGTGLLAGGLSRAAGTTAAGLVSNPGSSFNNMITNTAASAASGGVNAAVTGQDVGRGIAYGAGGGLLSGAVQDMGGSAQLGRTVGNVGMAVVGAANQPAPSGYMQYQPAVTQPVPPPAPEAPPAPTASSGFSSFIPSYRTSTTGKVRFNSGSGIQFR